MKSPLNILHLEDDPYDAAMVRSLIERAGIDCSITVVETGADFVAELKRGRVDLILSDHALPAFDSLSAMKIARQSWPDIPLILVSGTVGEELAVESLKNGATDYVLKERLSRLVPAVRRAMKEVEERAERKLLESQFIEAQKMEVVGQLAGGVAHDFNNILGIIMGYSETVLAEMDPENPFRADIDEIRLAAERAVALSQQLLVFSRKQTIQPAVVDLNAVMQTLDKMMRRLIDENIDLKVIPSPTIGHIKADPGHVGQIVMNLILNARDAMPHGGKLVIETSSVIVSEGGNGACGNAPAGSYVVLSVSDSGMGMTDEVKQHLFEAFFTTKPKGKGTGLGLATCQTILQQCGGYISFSSKQGCGTTFRVFWPQVHQPLDVKTASTPKGDLPGGTETLLMVEDDPTLGRLACGVLQKLGYTVLRASNGQDGLRMAGEHNGDPISLVVTDVIMPQMGGKVMAEWLKSTNPDLQILFTSGYTDDALSQHGVLDSGVSFLPKPYTPATLARKVREILDS